MSQSLSRERIRGPDGSPVRPNLPVRIKKPGGQGYFYFWGEVLRLKPTSARMHFKQRVLSLASRAIQTDRDKTYYNENNLHGVQLDLDYNLNPHVENAKHPPEYPSERPADDVE